MSLVIILIIILAVLLVIFTLQNSMDITLNIFIWEIADVPLVLVLIGCVILGYLFAAIYFYPKLWKSKKDFKQLFKSNKELKEFHNIDQEKEESEDDSNPEGIEMDDDKDRKSFFEE